jgi:8-oxo-dGTP pyrophosphatase MutT (NUDIX family)
MSHGQSSRLRPPSQYRFRRPHAAHPAAGAIRSLRRVRLEVPQRRPEGGETPEETALRETCGETGVLAEVIGRVPLD